MSETRRQYLERVSRVHDEWVKKYQDQVPLNPDAPPGSDYNEWIVDMDASPEAQSEFMRATAPPLEGFAPEPDDEVPMSDPYTEAKIARVSMCRAARGVADALLDHSMTVEEAEEQLGIAKREFAQRRSDTGDELYRLFIVDRATGLARR